MTMLQTELIQEFLGKKVIAVAGVSRDDELPANFIFRKLKEAGYTAFPINPNALEVEGTTCYHDLTSLPEKPEAVVLASTPKASEKLIEECASNHIGLVWMHRGIGKGSYSNLAEEKCKQLNIKAITNGCPLMFIDKVDPFHKFFRWLKKIS